MAAYLDPQDFILADDLLREILGALAEGHATLAKKSRSPVGTLVVKEAEVAVEFDFSVQARETAQGVGLRVRPPVGGGFFLLPGLEATQAKTQTDVVNRARVTVRIVNVLPPDEARPAPLPGKERPDTGAPDPGPPDAGSPSLTHAETLRLVGQVLAYIDAQAPGAAKLLAGHVDAIKEAMEDDAKALQRAVLAFVVDAQAILDALRGSPPNAITEALQHLTDAYSGAEPAADTLRVYNRDRIAALEPMLKDAGVKATSRRAFETYTTAALDSGRTVAARALVAEALRTLAHDLPGTVLPGAFFDTLEKLDLRDALESTDGAWRRPFEASTAQLRGLVGGLDLPRRAATRFDRGMGEVLASRSALEAGSRLVAVLDQLRQDTAALDLPSPVRDTLDRLGRPARA